MGLLRHNYKSYDTLNKNANRPRIHIPQLQLQLPGVTLNNLRRTVVKWNKHSANSNTRCPSICCIPRVGKSMELLRHCLPIP